MESTNNNQHHDGVLISNTIYSKQCNSTATMEGLRFCPTIQCHFFFMAVKTIAAAKILFCWETDRKQKLILKILEDLSRQPIEVNVEHLGLAQEV